MTKAHYYQATPIMKEIEALTALKIGLSAGTVRAFVCDTHSRDIISAFILIEDKRLNDINNYISRHVEETIIQLENQLDLI
jgi:hypothetical protein